MRSKLRRLRGLVQRYRVDRRLPPPVLDLVRRTAALRASTTTAEASARRLPVLGQGSESSPIGRLGGRRLVTAGDLDRSMHELGHFVATEVTAQLDRASIDHFVTSRRGDGLSFGLRLVDRGRALDALAELGSAGWFLEWEDGSRRGVEPLATVGSSRHVRRARSWVVFRAHSWGAHAVGNGQGTELTFWSIGTSGQLEKVGTRGHERFDQRCPSTVETIDGRPYPGNTAFPVGANFETVADPIDIVYTWVDGADPEWLESFRATAQAEGRQLDDTALDPARYRSRDELLYSLRSVWANCGWVRTIWIVTAGQRPDWLADADDRVRIVDHGDILPAEALPTFNSHAIEAALHRIEGLAEQFIYFNDDMFVGRSVRPELFFTPNGLARVFSSGARPPGIEDDQTLAVDTGARRGRELLAERFGRVVTDKPYHSPYPLLKSVCFDMERDFAEIVQRTQLSRFRSSTDVSTAASFGQHLAIATRRAVFGDIATEYVHVESGRLDWHLDRIRFGGDLDTFCINETSAAMGSDAAREQRLASFFAEQFPIVAPWERS